MIVIPFDFWKSVQSRFEMQSESKQLIVFELQEGNNKRFWTQSEDEQSESSNVLKQKKKMLVK